MSISQEHRYYLKLKALYYLYEEGYTQTEIAKQLNISRVTLSRLLEEAKAEGMIKFEIVDVRGAMKTLQLEEKLRQRFGLQDIKLVDCSGADTDTLTRKIGGSSQSVDFQPNILAQHLIDKYNGHATILTAPFMCQSKELCSAIKEEPTIASILKASHNLDVTLVGIGEAPVRDADHLSDYPFDTATINELVDAEAAGDICGNFFTTTGELCNTTLKNRIISIDIRDLPEHKRVIGVGGGEKKVRSILGALNGHYLHALITDVQTAEKVLELADDNTL